MDKISMGNYEPNINKINDKNNKYNKNNEDNKSKDNKSKEYKSKEYNKGNKYNEYYKDNEIKRFEENVETKDCEVGEDATKYGEFISSYFAWVSLPQQKENVEKLEKITKNEESIQRYKKNE